MPQRARIARELHDVVTHNVSVMVIQAGAARKIMHISPDEAGEALLAVEAGGRAAMTELRHVMGLLTMGSEDEGTDEAADPADEAAELAPQPGLDQLEALVGRVREAGLKVDLTVTGPSREIPAGVELAAYRVVQEALTNTVKHASGATATVAVSYAEIPAQTVLDMPAGLRGEDREFPESTGDRGRRCARSRAAPARRPDGRHRRAVLPRSARRAGHHRVHDRA